MLSSSTLRVAPRPFLRQAACGISHAVMAVTPRSHALPTAKEYEETKAELDATLKRSFPEEYFTMDVKQRTQWELKQLGLDQIAKDTLKATSEFNYAPTTVKATVDEAIDTKNHAFLQNELRANVYRLEEELASTKTVREQLQDHFTDPTRKTTVLEFAQQRGLIQPQLVDVIKSVEKDAGNANAIVDKAVASGSINQEQGNIIKKTFADYHARLFPNLKETMEYNEKNPDWINQLNIPLEHIQSEIDAARAETSVGIDGQVQSFFASINKQDDPEALQMYEEFKKEFDFTTPAQQ